MTEVPTPESVGSSGSQTLGSASMPEAEWLPPTSGLNLQQALRDINRTFSGHEKSILLEALLADNTAEKENYKRIVASKDSKISELTELLSEARKTIAIQNERLHSMKSMHLFKEITIFLGSSLLGVAVNFYMEKSMHEAYIIGIIGIALITLSQIFSIRGKVE